MKNEAMQAWKCETLLKKGKGEENIIEEENRIEREKGKKGKREKREKGKKGKREKGKVKKSKITKGRAGVYAIIPIFLSKIFNYAAAATAAKKKIFF